MREIKFRFWDKTSDPNGKMVSWENIKKFPAEIVFINAPLEITPMQFTGKKDCKGVDVYDGDIVEFDRCEWGGDDNIHIVSWYDKDASWCFGGGTTSDMHWRTVIGNIHENPELLEMIKNNQQQDN